MVSVAVSKLGKTDRVFVQLGAKINRVSITVITYSNKDYCQTFAIHRMIISFFSRTERRHTDHEFIEPENWPPNSPDLNPVDYSVWGAATDGVPSKNFRR